MTPSKKALQLLDKQIQKLDADPFNLEAWKSGAQSLLEMLFGASHASIAQIKALKVDYSSWALRDATAKYDPVTTSKLMGRELLENAKDEIELYGLTKGDGDKPHSKTASIATVSLTTVEKKKLARAMEMESAEKKLAEIGKIISKWKPERSAEVLASLLVSHPDTIS
ncbi:MAG: hypothetical protein RIF33_19610 [Cyclobacteriaceae bacterium]